MITMKETVYTAEDRFSIAQGLYWYCADYHGGQNSEEYEILSQLDYRPGRLERGPDADDSTARAVYEDLAAKRLDVDDVFSWVLANE